MDQRLVVGTAGNVSVRVDDLVVISPSGVDHATMTAKDVGVHDVSGASVEALLEPSSELPRHLAVHAASMASGQPGAGELAAATPVSVLTDTGVASVAQRLRGYGQEGRDALGRSLGRTADHPA